MVALSELVGSRMNLEYVSMVCIEFASLMKMGIVRPLSTQWSFPLYMIPRSECKSHLCCDYSPLNQDSTPDQYPVLHFQEFTTSLTGLTVFSETVLVWGYHQFPLAPDDVCKTAIITKGRQVTLLAREPLVHIMMLGKGQVISELRTAMSIELKWSIM